MAEGRDDIKGTHWIGEVVDNADPSNLGRCRVKVFGKFDDLPDDSIPWATPMNRDFVGMHHTPNIGTVVAVRFDNGNIYHPEYWFQIDQNKDLKADILDTSDAPQDVVSLVYDSTRNVRIYHSDKDGLVITRGTGAKERPIIQLDEAGIIKISSDDKIFLDAGNVYLSNTGEAVDGSDVTEDISEPTVRGKSLEAFLDIFKDLYNSHIHPTPTGPSGKPIIPWNPVHPPYQQENK
jgi:hypothetical protein